MEEMLPLARTFYPASSTTFFHGSPVFFLKAQPIFSSSLCQRWNLALPICSPSLWRETQVGSIQWALLPPKTKRERSSSRKAALNEFLKDGSLRLVFFPIETAFFKKREVRFSEGTLNVADSYKPHAGNKWQQLVERARKIMIHRTYILELVACYCKMTVFSCLLYISCCFTRALFLVELTWEVR